ncbi:glycosyltransferase family 4 protein [Kineococcus rhizosphaerae]|uniref:Glycosyltransferase involved in cell wall biosynthesis n=1 Tax=Kineococcus rhizosphaerae TaxID=559628 RepID=A0A2T0R5E6_9ACTN|nr:glycosyltransferase family 4 protein [Kineococcus rhizosphaerae]PRY15979.1 glycosyltransferase involved in cell wall biosynthesis [Kineococcus rhizosphaerae]
MVVEVGPAPTGVAPPGGLLLASRGDALTPFLFAEIHRRYPVSGVLQTDLTQWQRLAVAAATFRPSRVQWAEQFYKSGLGHALRSRNAEALRRRSPDPLAPVLQVHALFDVAGGAGSLLYVDCTHRQSAAGWAPWNPLRGRALERWYARETAAYRSARHIFAFSSATRDSLVGEYGVEPGRVTVVWAGANGDPGRGPAREDRAPGAAPNLLFIGNDFARKGGPDLLVAFAEVRRRFPGATLRLVGTRPDVPAQPGVEVLGRIHDREHVDRLYAQADVFVLPSIFDPLPLVLLEAMDRGVPIVTTASCGIPDVVRDQVEGRLVPPNDPRALAEALVRSLADPASSSSMAATARARVREEFTWERVVDRMAPVLDELARPVAGRGSDPSPR